MTKQLWSCCRGTMGWLSCGSGSGGSAGVRVKGFNKGEKKEPGGDKDALAEFRLL